MTADASKDAVTPLPEMRSGLRRGIQAPRWGFGQHGSSGTGRCTRLVTPALTT